MLERITIPADEIKVQVLTACQAPKSFEAPTPLGAYNPDWAVLMDNGEGERLYFVVETKPSAFLTDLRNTERAKIHCGEKHFEALAAGSQVGYECVHTYDELLMRVQA